MTGEGPDQSGEATRKGPVSGLQVRSVSWVPEDTL